MSELLCDGCGQRASAEHIARRLKRLELATRFRPIHVGTLFLAEAPPVRLKDYFYYPGADPSERTGLSRVLFDSLMQGLGIASPGADSLARKSDEACLVEFQRRGYFFADSLECPLEEIVPGVREGRVRANAFELAHRYGRTIIKRIQLSYKPKYIVLLSTRTRHLIPIFQQAGLGNQLLLYQRLPLHFPRPDNPAAQAQFRAGLAEVLVRVGARAKGTVQPSG